MKTNKMTIYFQRPIGIITTVMPMAVVLMFVFIGKKSLWLDEAFSVFYARQDLDELFRIISTRDANMSLYYFLLHFWVKFGNTEFFIRSLSAIFMLLTVPAIYLLGANLAGIRAGIIAMILFITNGTIIHYAQEARSYSLTVFLVTISSFFFVRIIEHPSKKILTGYIITSALAVYAHFFSFLVLIAHVVTVTAINRRSFLWKKFLISWLIILLLIFPLVLIVLFLNPLQPSWISEDSWKHIIGILGWLSGAMFFSVWSLLLGFSCSFLCLISLYFGLQKRHNSNISDKGWRYYFLSAWLFLPIAITFIVSILVKPIFVSRYLIICIPPLILLSSIGFSRIKNRRIFIVSLAILLILSSRQLHYQYVEWKKEDWRGVVQHVVANAKPDDAIVFHEPYIYIPFCYYFEKLNSFGLELPLYFFRDEQIKPYNNFKTCNIKKPSRNRHINFDLAYKRVWVILNRSSNEQRQIIQNFFLDHYHIRNKMLFNDSRRSSITVILYDKNTE